MTTTKTSVPQTPKPHDFEMALVKKLEVKSSSILRTFLELDVDRDGFITRRDLKTALHDQFGIALTKEQLDAIFYRFAYFESDGRDYEHFDRLENPEKEEDQGKDVQDSKKKDQSYVSGHQYGIRYSEFVKYMESTEKAIHSSQSVSSSMAGLGNLALRQGDFINNDDDDEYISLSQHRQLIKKLKKQLLQLIESHSKTTSAANGRNKGGGMQVTSLFLNMDTHRSGSVTVKEFQTWVFNMGWNVTEEELELILGKYYPQDKSNGGGIEFDDFAHFINELEREDIDNDEASSVAQGTSSQHKNGNKIEDNKAENDKTTPSSSTKKMIQNAIDQCVDDTKTDRDIIHTISANIFKKNTKLLDAFSKIDKSGTGKLDSCALQKAFQNVGGLYISQDRAQKLLQKFDRDGDGKLSKGEFIRLVTSSSSPPSLSPSSSSGDNDDKVDNQPQQSHPSSTREPIEVTNKSKQTGETTTVSSSMITQHYDTDNHSPNQEQKQVFDLVAPVIGHEDEKKCCNIVKRLDQDDIDIILQFRKILLKEKMQMRKVFHRLDTEGTRSLSVAQLRKGLADMGVHISEKHANHIMKRFDTEDTGKMKYYQFVKLVSADLC